MTLFGQTFDGQQIFGLVSILTLLAFWVVVWRRERQSIRWFRDWEAGRRARREAEERAERGEDRSHGGPWG